MLGPLATKEVRLRGAIIADRIDLLDLFHCFFGALSYKYMPRDPSIGTLVLLHGLGASHQQFDMIATQTSSSASVLLIDLPGHGENVVPPGCDISFENYCDLILSLFDELQLNQVDIVGISMGSALAMKCANRRPELVRQLILVRPSWLASGAPEHLSLIDRCGQWLASLPTEQALECLEADPFYVEMRDDVPLAAQSVRGVFDRPHARAHAPVLSAMFHDAPFATFNDVRTIAAPAIVIGTHADSLHPVAITNATANALPNAELRILPPRYLQPEKHQAALNELILGTIGDLA